MDEERFVALPQLYGAPAYARPPVAAARAPRPIDRDDLPLQVAMTDEDFALLQQLPDTGGRVPGTALAADTSSSGAPSAGHQSRGFRLPWFAGRLRPGR